MQTDPQTRTGAPHSSPAWHLHTPLASSRAGEDGAWPSSSGPPGVTEPWEGHESLLSGLRPVQRGLRHLPGHGPRACPGHTGRSSWPWSWSSWELRPGDKRRVQDTLVWMRRGDGGRAKGLGWTWLWEACVSGSRRVWVFTHVGGQQGIVRWQESLKGMEAACRGGSAAQGRAGGSPRGAHVGQRTFSTEFQGPPCCVSELREGRWEHPRRRPVWF